MIVVFGLLDDLLVVLELVPQVSYDLTGDETVGVNGDQPEQEHPVRSEVVVDEHSDQSLSNPHTVPVGQNQFEVFKKVLCGFNDFLRAAKSNSRRKMEAILSLSNSDNQFRPAIFMSAVF